MNKNTITIALDFPEIDDNISEDEFETKYKNGIGIGVNIHTIVNGTATEQLNADMTITENMEFADMWDKIGERIEKHMRNNSNYNAFGS